ncbi:aminotransferase class IV [Oleidesulfovibrio sp.]|uniref:aminotransferase class IV n=1 Tax=Oleidesulfovibrio sp. TaxID=2909707 RepID=UPI003A8AC967
MTYVRGNKVLDGPLTQHVTDPAFRFGVGFYETLLYNGRHLVNAAAHLSRISASMQTFTLPFEPVDLYAATEMLLDHLSLRNQMARINVFYTLEQPPRQKAQTKSSATDLLMVPTVTAAPYTPPPADKTFSLTYARAVISSALHAHKTTNHMLHYIERQHAQQQSFDDAILVAHDGTILETTTAALLFFDGLRFTNSHTTYRLASTAEALAANLLDITSAPSTPEYLSKKKHAYVLNSLMGMRPVGRIGDHTFTPDFDTCNEVTRHIQNAL